MLRSKLCAVVTSCDVTNALTGLWVCPAIVSASWFPAPAPTILNAGGCDVGALGLDIDGVLPPAPAADAACLVAPIALFTPDIIPAPVAIADIIKGIFHGGGAELAA